MDVDTRVKQFLAAHQRRWSAWNIPEIDGKFLYDLIMEKGYRRALEIGTHAGHSAIWIAWAMSKTGGRLTTIEISESHYKSALANFRQAGISEFIDARLGDAHDLVREMEGSFDFIFNDADKEWYKKYFVMLEPKLEVGGCFAAHNVSWTFSSGVREFLDYVEGLPHFETRIDKSSGEGTSISFKKAEK
jgi:predicted O-methyltransferase YrrM